MADEGQVAHEAVREAMRAVLPAARAGYVRAWTWLSEPGTPLAQRRAARERARAAAAEHRILADELAAGQSSDRDAALAREHLVSELQRLAGALERLATLTPHAVAQADDLRPEAVGCGRARPPRPASTSGASRPGRTDDGSNANQGRRRG